MRSHCALRLASSVALLALILCGSTAGAASTAAVRSANAAQLARSTSGGPTGGFVGMVPGIALTDPVIIGAGIFVATTFDYGDGTVVTYQPGETPSHTYAQAGFYKPVISSKTLGVVTLAIHVPFDGNQSDVYGMGVINQYDSAGNLTGALEFLPDNLGTSSIDFGDGSPAVAVDPSVNPAHVYSKAGTYTAVLTSTNGGASQSGSIRFAAPLSANNDVGKMPGIDITSFDATPNPTTAGSTVTFSGAFKSSNISGELSGSLDFGDGSQPETASGSALPGILSGQTTHVYGTDGVYKAVLAIGGGGALATSNLWIVVGSGTAVNPLDGLISSATVGATGTVTLNIIVSNLAGATTATTDFSDTLGRQVPVEGLVPSRTYTTPTISVATTVAKDAAAAPLAGGVEPGTGGRQRAGDRRRQHRGQRHH
ncbi:MAG: PKD domain-containing protein [Planctomycetota bacterium]|nr:PKD domain-containing protein [Planctomycetota bacterium]